MLSRTHLGALAALLTMTVYYYHWLAVEGRILVGYDTLTYFYPNEHYAAEALRSGRLPLWNPFLFTGVPFLANPQTAIFYPPNLLFLLLPVPQAYGYSIVLHVFLAGALTYAFGVATLRLHPWPALIAATVYAFSGFLGALAGHVNQLQVSAWLPLVLLVGDAVYRRRSGRLALAGSAVIAVQFLAGHMQEFYLSTVALALLVGWRALGEAVSGRQPTRAFSGELALARVRGGAGRATTRMVDPGPAKVKGGKGIGSPLRGVILVGLMLALGLGLAAVQFLPTYELTKESIRAGGMSYEEGKAFSLPPWLLLRSLLPAYGDAQPFSEWIGYVGVVALALAGLGLIQRRNGKVTLFAGMGLLALFLALGQYNPLYPLLYPVVPGLNLFRVPARWLVLYTFALAALAGIGAQALAHEQRRQRWRVLGTLVVALLAVGALLTLLAVRLNPTPTPELPGAGTVALWAAGFLAGAGVVWLGLARPGRLAQALAAALVFGELLLAGQGMELNRVNLPEAVASVGPAVTELREDPGVFRVLAFSEGSFTPGNVSLVEKTVGNELDEEGIYDYVVTAKHKETLTPNLPLLFRIASLDGYDGGVLPLRRYVELKSLLPLAAPNRPDARLREQLTSVPDVKLLSWLNVKYVLMDRLRDAWVDGVYYDLGLTRRLAPGGALTLGEAPEMEATTVGIISHLQGGQALPDGAAVAEVRVSLRSGAVYTTTLRAGVDTAEGRYGAPEGGGTVAHRQARRAKSWRDDPEGWDYATTVRLPEPGYVREIRIVRRGEGGDLAVRGASVIDERSGRSAPVVLDPALRLTYLGDVKIYENRAVLPRAFMVHDTVTVAGDEAALATMRGPDFDPARQAVLTAGEAARAAVEIAGQAGDSGDSVAVAEYGPEQVRIRTASASAALLLLTDSYYPGWGATVDGRPAPVLRADHLFRAVALPAGSHEVVFRYEPGSLRLGAAISLGSLALVVVGLAASARRRGGWV